MYLSTFESYELIQNTLHISKIVRLVGPFPFVVTVQTFLIPSPRIRKIGL